MIDTFWKECSEALALDRHGQSGNTEVNELNKLEGLLRDNNISYDREDDDGYYDFHQIRSPGRTGDSWTWDVVCNRGSYGWESGLLEMWGKNMDEPEGFLTAEECLKAIKKIIADI